MIIDVSGTDKSLIGIVTLKVFYFRVDGTDGELKIDC